MQRYFFRQNDGHRNGTHYRIPAGCVSKRIWVSVLCSERNYPTVVWAWGRFTYFCASPITPRNTFALTRMKNMRVCSDDMYYLHVFLENTPHKSKNEHVLKTPQDKT